MALPASGALGAAQFLGTANNASPGSVGFQWSSDLGLPPIASYPVLPFGSSDWTDTLSLTAYPPGGSISVFDRVTLAPIGPASMAAPVAVRYVRINGVSNGNFYGRGAYGGGRTWVYFAPATPGGPVYFALRWQAAHIGPVDGLNWWSLRYGGSTVANESSPANGMYTGVLGASDYSLPFDFEAHGGLASGLNGAILQDVKISVYADSSPIVGVEDALAPASVSMAAPSPNPVRDGATFGFAVPRPGEVTLLIFDVTGRSVRELPGGWREQGRHELRWDRRDANGAAVSPGVYWARLSLASAERTETALCRLVVIAQ